MAISAARKVGKVVPVTYEFTGKRTDGREIPVEVTAASFPFEDGGQPTTMAILRDISERKRVEEDLHQFRLGIETAGDAIFLTDKEGVITYVNPAFQKMYGYSSEEALGKTPRILKSDVHAKEVYEQFWKTILDKEIIIGEIVNKTKDGQLLIVASSTNPILDSAGEIIGFLAVQQDITERKRAEEALQESEQKYRAITETANDAIVVADCNRTIISWNHGASKIFGYADEEILGQLLDKLMPMSFKEQHIKGFERVVAGGQPSIIGTTVELVGLRKDGEEFPLELSLSTWKTAQGEFFTCIIRDISWRKQAEKVKEELYEQVVESQTKLEALSGQLVSAQEAERRNIARELHDEIGQELTAISIQLGKLQDSNADSALGEDLDQLVDMVNTSLDNIRHLSRELRPSILDDLGLVPALRWLFKRQAPIGGFRASIDDAGLKTRPAPKTELVCYRIIQEALTNIIKHAHASEVKLKLAVKGDILHIKIQDNGSGFDVDAAFEKAASGESMGLLSIEERANLIGGKIEIISEISKGTMITGQFPLPPNGKE